MKNSFIKVILFTTFLTLFMNEGATFYDGSDFLKMSQTKTFVDKTLLIKEIFQQGNRILINAPPKFGKSTNLQMIKLFLSTNSLKLRNVYKIFAKLRIYKDDKSFFEENFGKWPVLYADFSTKADVLRLEDEVDELRKSIHRSYKDHSYLMKSKHLDEYDKVTCENWINDCRNMQECDISEGLPNLVTYLNKHFKRHVIALVDGYDDVITTALARVVDDSTFERLVTLISTVLENLLNSKLVKLERAVVTGVCYSSSGEMMNNEYLERFSFLNGHSFAKFYGFSSEEVSIILDKMVLKLNETQTERLHLFHNGYYIKNSYSVFNPYTISMFLNVNTAPKYMEKSKFTEKTFHLIKYLNIEEMYNNLLSGSTCKATIYRTISKEKVIELKDFYHRLEDDPPDVNLFLTHLMELGYLTYVPPKNGGKHAYEVKIPNMETKKSLLEAYKKYYIESYDLNSTYVKDMGYSEFKSVLMSCSEYREKLNYEKRSKTM